MKSYCLIKRISLKFPCAEPTYYINYGGHAVTDFTDLITVASQAAKRDNFSPTDLQTISSFDWGPTKEGIEGKFLDCPVTGGEMANFLHVFLESRKTTTS